MTEKAKLRYSAQDGVLELEGSEEFVSKHFESLTDLIRIISRHVVIEQKTENPSQPASQSKHELPIETATQASDTPPKKEGIASYPNFFSEINGKLKIVSDLPGNNTQSKMKNAAILFSYGSKLLGDEQVSSKDIRAVCEEHGYLDTPNYSKVFSDKTIFISDGIKGGNNKEIKLTFQGEKKAKELLASVKSED